MILIIRFSLIKDVVVISVLSSILIVNLVQIIKENFKLNDKKICIIISFVSSIVLGSLFGFTFSHLNFIYCLWSGLFCFLLADFIYKCFEDKVFKSYKRIVNVKEG